MPILIVDGSDEQSHPIFLFGEDVLDPRADFRCGVVGPAGRPPFRKRLLFKSVWDSSGEFRITNIAHFQVS